MVGFSKIFGYLWLGKYIFLTQNIFSSAPTLGINSDRSLKCNSIRLFIMTIKNKSAWRFLSVQLIAQVSQSATCQIMPKNKPCLCYSFHGQLYEQDCAVQL